MRPAPYLLLIPPLTRGIEYALQGSDSATRFGDADVVRSPTLGVANPTPGFPGRLTALAGPPAFALRPSTRQGVGLRWLRSSRSSESPHLERGRRIWHYVLLCEAPKHRGTFSYTRVPRPTAAACMMPRAEVGSMLVWDTPLRAVYQTSTAVLAVSRGAMGQFGGNFRDWGGRRLITSAPLNAGGAGGTPALLRVKGRSYVGGAPIWRNGDRAAGALSPFLLVQLSRPVRSSSPSAGLRGRAGGPP